MYDKTRENQTFCKPKCRYDFNNYGRTPQAQVENRLRGFMKTPAFRELMRETVAKEVRVLLSDPASCAALGLQRAGA